MSPSLGVTVVLPPPPPRPLGASAGWHGCVPQCVLQAAEAGSGDGDGAAGAFDVDEGFAFLKLLKCKKGSVANVAEEVGFAARAVKKGKARKAVAAKATTATKQVAKASRSSDTSWWTEPLTRVRVVNAASPKRTYVVGSSKSSPKKMRLVVEITEKQSKAHAKLIRRIVAQIESRKMCKNDAQKLRNELLG